LWRRHKSRTSVQSSKLIRKLPFNPARKAKLVT
jgi:hypothetical protein